MAGKSRFPFLQFKAKEEFAIVNKSYSLPNQENFRMSPHRTRQPPPYGNEGGRKQMSFPDGGKGVATGG